MHLKGWETKILESGQERNAVATNTKTTLTTWFDLDAQEPDGNEPEARPLLDTQIPEHFVWKKKEGKWQRRQRMSVATSVIGRRHSANPSEGHRFYLYLFLFHRRGACSFEHLVIVTMPGGSAKTFLEQQIGDNGVLKYEPDYRKQLKNLALSLQTRSTNFS